MDMPIPAFWQQIHAFRNFHHIQSGVRFPHFFQESFDSTAVHQKQIRF
jgi:hypothetical protein